MNEHACPTAATSRSNSQSDIGYLRCLRGAIRNNCCNAFAVGGRTDKGDTSARGGICFTNCAREHAWEKREHQEGENSLHRGHVCRLLLSHTKWHGDTTTSTTATQHKKRDEEHQRDSGCVSRAHTSCSPTHQTLLSGVLRHQAQRTHHQKGFRLVMSCGSSNQGSKNWFPGSAIDTGSNKEKQRQNTKIIL